MKKLTALLLTVVMLLIAVCGCAQTAPTEGANTEAPATTENAAEPAAEPLPQSALESLASPQAFLAPVLQPQAVAAALESGKPTPLLHRLALINAWAEAHALRLA